MSLICMTDDQERRLSPVRSPDGAEACMHLLRGDRRNATQSAQIAMCDCVSTILGRSQVCHAAIIKRGLHDEAFGIQQSVPRIRKEIVRRPPTWLFVRRHWFSQSYARLWLLSAMHRSVKRYLEIVQTVFRYLIVGWLVYVVAETCCYGKLVLEWSSRLPHKLWARAFRRMVEVGYEVDCPRAVCASTAKPHV